MAAQAPEAAKFLSPEQFTDVLGQVAWLMTMSKAHKELPMSALEHRVLPALLLKQFKLYKKGKQPVAFLSWALVSDAAAAKLDAGEDLQLQEWRSGDALRVVDCVSPFAERATLEAEFLNEFGGAAAQVQ